MQEIILQSVFLTLQMILLFFVSRFTIAELFHAFRTFFHNDNLVFSLVSLVFLPGTIIHEFAHFFAALFLFLNVRDLKIFPEWKGNYIKLGRVTYEKKDVFRSILVGIAPIIAGLIFFWWISIFKIFPTSSIFLNIFIGYIIFAVSSSMFSSKQDIIDLVYIIPFGILVVFVIYIFNINFDFLFKNSSIVHIIENIIHDINIFLLFSLVIHIVLIVFFKSLRAVIKR